MELKDAIRGRRSVRKYKPTPVSKETIMELYEMASWAPSGMNRQNWFFVAVTGEYVKKVAEICHQGYKEYIGSKVSSVFSHKPQVVKETTSFFATLGGAPVVVFAYAEPGPESQFTDVQSVSAAIQNMLLAAYDMGLGTCWMTGPLNKEKEFNQLLGVEGKKLVALITLGYPDETPKPPKRKGVKIDLLGFDQ